MRFMYNYKNPEFYQLEDFYNEIWRNIKGYEGYYQISNYGRVKSLKRAIKQGRRYVTVNEKIIKPFLTKNGYLRVNLSKNGKDSFLLIGRIVLSTFKSNKKGLVCHHINGNKLDNRINNLFWISRSKHTEFHNYYNPRNNKGERNGRSKLLSKDIMKIKLLFLNGLSYKEISRFYNVKPYAIGSILRRRTWKHIKHPNLDKEVKKELLRRKSI